MNALMAENGDWENSGFQEFVTELERFLLSDEKTNQMLLPGIMDGLNEINNFESYIDTRIKGFTFSPKEFEDKIKKQYPQKEQILTDKNKMSDFIDTRKANLVQKLRKKSRDEINFTLNDISNYIESWNGEISNKEEIAGLKKQLAEYVKVGMMDMVEILKSSISDETNFIIEKTNMHYKQLISDIRQYQNNVSNLEDIVIEINTDDLITIDIEESTPDIIIPFVTILITTIVLGPLGLIAGFIFGVPMGNAYKEKQRKKLLGKVKSRVVPKLRKEFEKVTPQLLKALDKIIDDYKSKIISKLNAMIRNIENAIKSIQNEQENTKSDIEEKIRQLKVLKSNFDEIGQSLRASSKILN